MGMRGGWVRTTEDERACDDPDGRRGRDVEIERINDVLEELWDLDVEYL